MSQLSANIKIIRKLYNMNQTEFADLFTNITLGKQKSYESGTNPGPLYMEELSELAGVTEKQLRNNHLTKKDIFLQVEKVNKGKKEEKGENIRIPLLTKNELSEDMLYNKVAIIELMNQVAKATAKIYGRPVADCKEEMEQNMILLLKDLKEGK